MTSQSVVTRFAPSPTGFLHIGGARTALFNYLFSKHHNGKFYLRVEDTDQKRSTQEAIDAILYGLSFLDLKNDDDIVYQSQNIKKHQDVAHDMVKRGVAYYCYATQEELEAMRQEARSGQKKPSHHRRWRDSKETPPSDIKPTIRIKVPLEGKTTIHDLIQGEVSVDHHELDDFILLRSDGTPTYMLSVVVDDHLMGITHVIRGDDHLSNTFRQLQIYNAMGWETPKFAHIPLIHGHDGSKMSKRHGALGVDFYEKEGFLPEAICNYLLRLGWSHGNDEIISRKDAISWFDLDHVGKSPSRFDLAKLSHVNHVYMNNYNKDDLISYFSNWCEKYKEISLSNEVKQRLLKGISGLLKRSQTLEDLFTCAFCYLFSPQKDDLVENFSLLKENKKHISHLLKELNELSSWQEQEIKDLVKNYCQSNDSSLKEIMPVLRWALTAKKETPPMFEVLYALGQNETIKRLHFIEELSF